MIEADVSRAAAQFWGDLALAAERPRPIERAVGWALPVAVVGIPRLGFGAVRRWLNARGIDGIEDGPDRPLRGCLVASRGHGIVFVDGGDPDAERRFSIAHEVAHFILDYEQPRRDVVASLGMQAAEILDGVRAPTVEEKLAAVLRGVPLGCLCHLMLRGPRGAVRQDVLEAEDRADRLALELLAPRAEVARAVRAGCQHVLWEAIHEVLVRDFDLPDGPARTYAEHIVARSRGPTSTRKWLGL